MKLFIIGPSGSGKTTIANHLAEKYGIHFLNLSALFLLKDWAPRTHKEIILQGVQDPQLGLRYQWELAQRRRTAFAPLDDFIADRSPIDNMVYFMQQNAPFLSGGETEHFLHKAVNTIPHDAIFVFLDMEENYSKGVNIANDGRRILNVPYQRMMNRLFKDIIRSIPRNRNGIEIITIKGWDFDKRIKEIEYRLGLQKKKLWQRILLR